MAKIPRTTASARNDMNAIVPECFLADQLKTIKVKQRWGNGFEGTE
jgi:hypothetical protein